MNKQNIHSRVTALLDELNSLTGRSWALIRGNPHVNCEWMLTTGEGAGNSDILCESNMLSVIGEYLNGVRCGYELRNVAQPAAEGGKEE